MIAAYSDSTLKPSSFIGGAQNKQTVNKGAVFDYTYTIPQDCYVLISNRSATEQNPSIYLYRRSYDYKSDIIDLYTLEWNVGYLTNGTTWSTTQGKHVKIPVQFCEEYNIKSDNNNNIQYTFLESDGTTTCDGMRHTVASGNNVTIVTPLNAVYLYIQIASSGGTDYTKGITVKKVGTFDVHRLDKAIHQVGLMNIEYSVLSGYPGNTLAHFEKAVTDGFRYLKADMRITSDNKVVLCHDNGYTFDGNGRIISYNSSNKTLIATMTLSEILALEFAQQVEGQYVHPCSLEQFMILCKKKRCIPFLTVRSADYILTIPECNRLLKKYSLDDVAIYNIYVEKTNLFDMCLFINSVNPYTLKCYTTNTNDTYDVTSLALAFELKCRYVDVWNTQESLMTDDMWSMLLGQNMSILSMIYNETDYENAVNGGFIGFQNNTRNTFQ